MVEFALLMILVLVLLALSDAGQHDSHPRQ